MIKNEEDFSRVAQSCMTPIYFFDQKNPPNKSEKITRNGTVTLFRNEHKIYGITNYHVYEGYEKKKNANKHTICQIGYQCKIELEDKIRYTDEINDLVIFDLNDDDLNKMSTAECQKTGFTVLDDRIDEYLKKYQDENNYETWFLHFAGYPAVYKKTEQISATILNEEFGIISSYARGSYIDEKTEIILDYSAIKEDGAKITPSIGTFSKENMVFGGISGGPVFARIHQDHLSLLGIIYKGSGEKDGIRSSFEFIYAKPISLIKNILLSC